MMEIRTYELDVQKNIRRSHHKLKHTKIAVIFIKIAVVPLPIIE
jgi:hypothetical protein